MENVYMTQRRAETVREEKRIAKELSYYVKSALENPDSKFESSQLDEYLYQIFSLEVREMGLNPHRYGDKIGEQEKKVVLFKTGEEGSAGVQRSDSPDLSYVSVSSKKIFNELSGDPVFVPMLFVSVFHELEHIRQRQMIYSGISSPENLHYAKEFAIAGVGFQSNRTLRNHYRMNENSLYYIENDANYVRIYENATSYRFFERIATW